METWEIKYTPQAKKDIIGNKVNVKKIIEYINYPLQNGNAAIKFDVLASDNTSILHNIFYTKKVSFNIKHEMTIKGKTYNMM